MMMRKLLVATHNRGKLAEIKELAQNMGITLVDLTDFPQIKPIDESGKTFIENASLKAAGYAKATNLLTLADDSGLMVDALDGAPGVHSARYAGEGASDAERTKKLLIALADAPEAERTAKFVSAIAIANQSGSIIHISVGECLGRIAFTPAGEHGFGYDPVFIPDGFSLTFGQLDSAIKNRISHRARALSQATTFLRALTASSSTG
jgi:XTP/dITP diphosphohydrolase